jgi:hypothetical protein
MKKGFPWVFASFLLILLVGLFIGGITILRSQGNESWEQSIRPGDPSNYFYHYNPATCPSTTLYARIKKIFIDGNDNYRILTINNKQEEVIELPGKLVKGIEVQYDARKDEPRWVRWRKYDWKDTKAKSWYLSFHLRPEDKEKCNKEMLLNSKDLEICFDWEHGFK